MEECLEEEKYFVEVCIFSVDGDVKGGLVLWRF